MDQEVAESKIKSLKKQLERAWMIIYQMRYAIGEVKEGMLNDTAQKLDKIIEDSFL